MLFSQSVNPDGTYPNGGFNVTGGGLFGYQSIASQFTLDADALLTRIDIGLAYIEETSGRNVVIKLERNDPVLGIPNGQIITSGTATATAPLNNSSIAPTSFLPSSSTIALTAGETYWIVAEPADSSTAVVWTSQSRQSTFSVSHFANSSDGSNYVARYSYDWTAFQVIGSQVPEPSSLLFLCLGSMFFLRRGVSKPQ